MSEWIEWKWTAEKPYPETLDTKLDMVRFRNGGEGKTFFSVGDWYGTGSPGTSNWEDTGHPDEIVAYRVIE